MRPNTIWRRRVSSSMDWRPVGVVRLRAAGGRRPGAGGVETVAHAIQLSESVACAEPMTGRGGKMMTRRSTGKTRVARALWYASKGVVELRTSRLPPPAPGEALRAHAVQRHQPRHRAARVRGGHRPERVGAHALPNAGGRVSFPSQIRLLRDWRGRGRAAELVGPARVLPASAPGFLQRAGRSARADPDDVPARRATLAANMETALNAVWDSGAGPGDRIVVVGAGVVGLLVASLAARLPGAEVTAVDVDDGAAPAGGGAGRRVRAPRAGAGRRRRRLPRQRHRAPASTRPSIAPGSRRPSSR